ncbi:MAG: DEAD/DEAH box helicase, partial [Gemmatimonadales bacterium]|nr:DEAD/DEAH box helicase [Gemmatimonadales bacterium]
LWRERGAELTALAQRFRAEDLAWKPGDARQGFGIVAGTGTGKTLSVRPLASVLLGGDELRVGVINREREATPETPSWNVVVVTTGIARRWFTDDLITRRDTVIVDEIHQTSAELELCLALGKRAGVRFIWLSATVDPAFYRRYLDSAEVLETSAFDPRLRAKVEVVPQQAEEFLDDKFVKRLIREGRGVAVFVPTRAEVEKLAAGLGARWPRLATAFYHGGEPIRVIRPFLEGQVEKPFLLAMTAAGQSALNLPGLDTVIIYDARYGNVVERGRNVLHRMYLGANEILQMAGRVHGRVANGEVTILSDRDLRFEALRPTPPEFQLAGDAERVAITCAALGVDARDLDLPVPLDRIAYTRALDTLTRRGLVDAGRLTPYGRRVEAMPVERAWGELLAHADEPLLPVVAVCSNIDSLHRMTREERDLHGVVVNGSDHLTAYNLFVEAVNRFGRLGEVHGLPRHLFEEAPLAEWAEGRGVLVKAIEDIALGTASVFRALERPLPAVLPYASKELRHGWQALLAKVMPFDLVIDERTADGQEVRVGKTSVAGSWGAVAGNLRFFADRFGVPRASIEGTTLPYDVIREHAAWGKPVVEVGGPRKHQRLAVRRHLEYFGFELDADVEPLEEHIPPELREQALDALVAALMEGETVHPDQGKVKRALAELDELWRRSGGQLEPAAPAARRALLRGQLEGVTGWHGFLGTRVQVDVAGLVAPGVRGALLALPGAVRMHGDMVALDYEVEGDAGVVRLRLREGLARRLALKPTDIPRLDRPVRFALVRGHLPPVLGDSIPGVLAALRKAEERQRHRGGGRRTRRR